MNANSTFDPLEQLRNYFPLLSVLLLVFLIALFHQTARFSNQIKRNSPDTWDDLNRPYYFLDVPLKNFWKIFKFFPWTGYKELGDQNLNRTALVIKLLLIANFVTGFLWLVCLEPDGEFNLFLTVGVMIFVGPFLLLPALFIFYLYLRYRYHKLVKEVQKETWSNLFPSLWGLFLNPKTVWWRTRFLWTGQFKQFDNSRLNQTAGVLKVISVLLVLDTLFILLIIYFAMSRETGQF